MFAKFKNRQEIDDYVKENYSTEKTVKIARKFKVKETYIWKRARVLGLTKKRICRTKVIDGRFFNVDRYAKQHII